MEDKGKPFDNVESAVHNRLIPLIEIIGAMTETSYSEGSNSTFFKMKLITKAETYNCQFLQPVCFVFICSVSVCNTNSLLDNNTVTNNNSASTSTSSSTSTRNNINTNNTIINNI